MKLIRLVFNGFTCSLLSIKRGTNRSFMFLGGLLVTVFALKSEVCVWGGEWGGVGGRGGGGSILGRCNSNSFFFFDPRPLQF